MATQPAATATGGRGPMTGGMSAPVHRPLKYLEIVRVLSSLVYTVTIWFWTLPYRIFRFLVTTVFGEHIYRDTVLPWERSAMNYILPALSKVEETGYSLLRWADERIDDLVGWMGEETTTGTSRFASYRERILRGSADVFDRVQKEGLRAVLPGGQHGTTSPTAGMAPMPKAAGATAR